MEIIGENRKLRDTLKKGEMVAPTDCTALILGETGTGKELAAELIHNRSPQRHHRPFIKVNCAAIPLGLLESELFGHERGAFTGALSRRIGCFEVADKGTLFLHKIGDIHTSCSRNFCASCRSINLSAWEAPAPSKPMCGSSRRRIVTCPKWWKRAYLQDLYYRLNVFRIILPPLRERVEDIPHLIRHFTRQYAQRLKKRIEAIPSDVMDVLARYSWPGNVRELQNFVERAVILTSGSILDPPLEDLAPFREEAAVEPVTLRDAERAHILRTLKKTNGQHSGAATLLGGPRSTLFYRIRRLGITFARPEKARKPVERLHAVKAAPAA